MTPAQTTSTSIMPEAIDTPVRQSITVRASLERTFRVFTAEFDSWWPRSHHIGSSPMKRAIIEPRVGGRCYSEQVDGTDCPWGTVLAWDPPHRLVFAWQVTHQWGFEPDLSKASEVEVRFTAVGDKSTRVDLEHRHFSRHGDGGASMRESVGNPDGGWGGLLQIFAAKLEV
ncbi:MAG TPA: SRPBCC family protein [Gemmatimonadaceae bacterium]